MANHTTRDTRAGFPTFGLASQPSSATTGRGGLGFSSANVPQILDDAGNVALTATPTGTTLSVGGTAKLALSALIGVPETYKLVIPVQGAVTGVFASILNPFGAAVIVTRALLVVTTQSTGAATVDVGVAADATTSNDGLLDGKTVATAGTFDNLTAGDVGTNGKAFQAWGTTQYLNVAEASGDVTGMIGYLLVTAQRTGA